LLPAQTVGGGSVRLFCLSHADIDDFLSVLDSAQTEVDDEEPQWPFSHLLPLCRVHRLTSYDAMYHGLAGPTKAAARFARRAAPQGDK